MVYKYYIAGTSGSGVWEYSGNITVKPGAFLEVPHLALQAAFTSLQMDQCTGPYQVTKMVVEVRLDG